MLKAKLDSIRKNKKGFSLVELIIVIAIMVALIAVMAPSFIKYVNKSRAAALGTAAEDFCSFVKTEVASGNVTFPDDTQITVQVTSGKLAISDVVLAADDIAEDAGYDDWDSFKEAAGADETKSMGQTEGVYTIKVDGNLVTMETPSV